VGAVILSREAAKDIRREYPWQR